MYFFSAPSRGSLNILAVCSSEVLEGTGTGNRQATFVCAIYFHVTFLKARLSRQGFPCIGSRANKCLDCSVGPTNMLYEDPQPPKCLVGKLK